MLSQAEIITRLFLGAVLGGLIGFERQVHGRQAGFRTQLIVCVASVLIMIVSEQMSQGGSGVFRSDPGRIAAGAITGIGFIGAGAILKMGITIQGLTTAACLWMVSAIGLAVGAGLYLAGIAATSLTLFSLLVLRIVERQMSRIVFKFITITADDSIDDEKIRAVFKTHDAQISKIDYERDIAKKETSYDITVSLRHHIPMKAILDEFSAVKSVKKIVIRG